jgi:hypothetical protein
MIGLAYCRVIMLFYASKPTVHWTVNITKEFLFSSKYLPGHDIFMNTFQNSVVVGMKNKHVQKLSRDFLFMSLYSKNPVKFT